MVGSEAAIGSAVAKGVSAAASEVLSDEPSIKVSVAEKAKESAGLQKAAAIRGQRAAVRQAFILQLWRPLARLVGVSREYFEDGGQFAVDMADTLEKIPDEKIMAPTATVAVPAMQGLGFSLDEPTLKAMYLQLLAEASNSETHELAHPSFAQVIRELQPEEAILLQTIFTAGTRHPIARIDRHNDGAEGFSIVRKHVMPFIDQDSGLPVEGPRSLRVWIDNWERLGLAHIDYSTFLANSNAYHWMEGCPELESARRDCLEGASIAITRGILDLTDFGQQFANVVFERK